MSDNPLDALFDRLADKAEAEEPLEQAPSSLKARLYSALIQAQQEEGPLQALPETAASGHKLCVFERLVAAVPLPEGAQQFFYCQTCHARVIAEHFDNPPIYWPHCPYADLKNR